MTIAEAQERVNRAFFREGQTNPQYFAPELTKYTMADGTPVAIVGNTLTAPYGTATTYGWLATLQNGTQTKSDRHSSATLALAALFTYLGTS